MFAFERFDRAGLVKLDHPRLRFRVEVFGEKLRGEEHFVDKPAHRVPIDVVGNGQLALARRD